MIIKKTLAPSLASLLVLCAAFDARADQDFYGLGSGRDGALTVTTTNAQINTYTHLTADAAAGATLLTVISEAGIAAGDLVMVWQTQRDATGAPAIGDQSDVSLDALGVGRWEFARVASVASGEVTLSAGLSHAYTAAGAQVIRVPEYTTLTINAGQSVVAKPWDGASGGIVVALVQGALVNNGSVSAASSGFRGGLLANEPGSVFGCSALELAAPSGAQRGEGLLSGAYGSAATGRGNLVQGGGGGVCHNSGGGGGGHMARGGLGGRSYSGDGSRLVGGLGGARITYDPLRRLMMGGGGGAGHQNNSVGSAGGRGGGTIFIRSADVSGAGTFNVNGANAAGGGNDGQGGGGAGGALVLRAQTTLSCAGQSARGGAGGSLNSSAHGPGGGGAGGLIATQQTGGVCAPNVTGGLAGVQTSAAATDGVHFGAQPTPSTLAQYIGALQTLTNPTTTIDAPADGATVGGQPAISGTTTPNTAVRVTIDGATLGTVTSDAAGVWIVAPITPLTDGAHTIGAQAEGSIAAPITRAVTVDATAPALTLDTPANNASLNTDSPTIRGTAEPNSTITVTLSDGSTLMTTADGAGQWSVVPAAPLAEGLYTASATATDGVGNTSAPATTAFTIDLTAPNAVTITTPIDGSTTGDSTPDIAGAAEPNSTVTVTLGGSLLGTTTANASGDWTITPNAPLADGTYSVNATATDAAGNTSPASPTTSFTVDTIAPNAITINAPADGSTISDSTPAISGTTEPNATVTVTLDGSLLGTTTANASGDWSITPGAPLAEGDHTIVATASDAAGNVSAPTTSGFTVDTAAPGVAIITTPADGALTADSTPTISGTAEPNSTVTITLDGSVLGTATADAAGSWTITPNTPLADGPHTVEVTATDAAGNTSPASPTTSFTVDTTAPNAVTITTPADGATLDALATISGTTEPNATVEVTLDGSVLGTVTADAAGVWSIAAPALADGAHTVEATASDAAGNVSAPTTSGFTIQDLFVDVLDPAPTSADTYTLTGAATPGQVVTIEQDGQTVGTVTADASGAWTFESSALPEGDYAITVRVTQGGQSATDTTTVTLDRTAPALVIESPVDGATTNVETPTISGTAEPGATVEVQVNGEQLTTTADASGAWRVTPTAALPFGATVITATAEDAAGNTTTDTATITVVDDAGALDLTILSPADLSTITTRTPTLTGTTAPGATVEVLVDGVSVGTATADASGAWTLTIPAASALADGDRAIEARSTDGQDTATVAITVTVVDPVMVPLVINTPTDGATTGDDTPTISGTAAPGATVEVFVDDVSVGTATADANGAWTLDAPALDDGAHTVRADSGDESVTVTVTVDTTAPTTTLDSPTAGETVTTGTPTFGGTGEPGSTVTVLIDGQPVGTATVGDDGTWTLTPDAPISEGDHTVTVTGTDTVGNTTTLDPITITIDAGAEGPTGSITSPTAGETVTTGTPTITGTATPGSTVEVIVDGQVIDTVTADASGAWSVTPDAALGEGDHTIEVRVTLDDESVTVGPITVTVDTTGGARDTSDYMLAGGCAAAPGQTPDAGLSLLGMLLGLVGWRRRR